MKFAAFALLFSGVIARRGGGGRSSTRTSKSDLDRLSDEQREEFFKLFLESSDRMYDLPDNSKIRHMWLNWMRGDAKMMEKFILGEVYKKDGPWDQFAGEDGRMTFDEASAMNQAIRENVEEDMKEKLPK